MSKSVTPKQVIATLKAGIRHDLVILAIPSHDRKNKKISDQDQWADEALRLFSTLYGGATAFETFAGVYKSSEDEDLWDEPILIESYAERERVESESNLKELLDFARRMRKGTDQESILLVLNEYRWFIGA